MPADTPLLDQHWNNATDRLNRYVSEEGGGTIDWERARAIFNKLATSGQGNFGDWVNGVMAQRTAWVNVKPAAETPTTTGAAAGNKVYGGDLYGSLDKWNDPNHKTPKYVVGRIVEKYYNGRDNAGEAMAKALAEVQALFPGTTFDGKHRYNIPGVSSSIDMKSGKGRLQWYDDDAVARNKPTPPTTPTTTTTAPARVAVGLSNPALLSAVPDRWNAATTPVRRREAPASPTWTPQQASAGITLQTVMPRASAAPMTQTPLTPQAPLMRPVPLTRTRAPLTLRDYLMRGR